MKSRSTEFWFAIAAAVVGTVIGGLILAAIQRSDANTVRWVLSASFGFGAAVGALYVIQKFITPRVEASDQVWDGLALLVGGTIGVTLVAVLGGVIGMWIAAGSSPGG